MSHDDDDGKLSRANLIKGARAYVYPRLAHVKNRDLAQFELHVGLDARSVGMLIKRVEIRSRKMSLKNSSEEMLKRITVDWG